jgi:hypothetical protein
MEDKCWNRCSGQEDHIRIGFKLHLVQLKSKMDHTREKAKVAVTQGKI